MNKTLFAKGKRGLIYRIKWKGKDAVVKIKNPESAALSRIANEGYYLELLNQYGIGPRMFYFNDEMVAMEFIDGVLIESFVKECCDKIIIKKAIIEILKQCYTLDYLHINKAEMHHPVKHIIVRKNKPVLIDFERCRKSIKVKNVTQFCQFITSSRFSSLLKEKKIIIEKEELIRLSQEYSRAPTKENFERIKNLI
ncbi:hypothetical protein JXA85_01920 [Candidatus Woesearchaeota archaeon]|nr:hypothetical protein [Candidatus Woesearchaeota archaeon]